MDYRKISFELKLNKHLKAIPEEFIVEWKKVIKSLVMAPFVKQLEPHPDATDFYDVFIFIDGPKQYIMKIDEDRTNIFFSNEYPYFLSSLEKTPNCELQNPIALSINEQKDLISFSCSAYFELLMTLKNKKLISPSKISYLMRCLNIYQTSFLKEIDLQLLSTEYFKDVWSFYHSVLQMDKEFHYDEGQGIRIEKIPSLNAVIIKRAPYQEIYFLNQYKKMFVIPIDYGKNSIGFFNQNY
ncbi:MAG: hypothetical protein RSD40_07090 [Bacilli bacterium]